MGDAKRRWRAAVGRPVDTAWQLQRLSKEYAAPVCASDVGGHLAGAFALRLVDILRFSAVLLKGWFRTGDAGLYAQHAAHHGCLCDGRLREGMQGV
eukprot:gene35116-26115_t